MKDLFYAGLVCRKILGIRSNELAVETIGQRINRVAGLGSTNTRPSPSHPGPTCVGAGFGCPRRIQPKLAPEEPAMEARVRGPSITPGYWPFSEQTAKAFDEEGSTAWARARAGGRKRSQPEFSVSTAGSLEIQG